MAYGAIPGHAALLMARDAEPHVVHVVDLVDLGHARDVAMAGLAGIRSQRLDVPHVGEMRVTRHEMEVPAITVWQPMQVCIDGIPGSGETATE